eukprot:INCI5359.2.p1 GENE.INCI5359.2~~INCI5359.2.p1  ORF type:complete len:553 (-),score=36.58 INCI5359.2:497-2155(-)
MESCGGGRAVAPAPSHSASLASPVEVQSTGSLASMNLLDLAGNHTPLLFELLLSSPSVLLALRMVSREWRRRVDAVSLESVLHSRWQPEPRTVLPLPEPREPKQDAHTSNADMQPQERFEMFRDIQWRQHCVWSSAWSAGCFSFKRLLIFRIKQCEHLMRSRQPSDDNIAQAQELCRSIVAAGVSLHDFEIRSCMQDDEADRAISHTAFPRPWPARHSSTQFNAAGLYCPGLLEAFQFSAKTLLDGSLARTLGPCFPAYACHLLVSLDWERYSALGLYEGYNNADISVHDPSAPLDALGVGLRHPDWSALAGQVLLSMCVGERWCAWVVTIAMCRGKPGQEGWMARGSPLADGIRAALHGPLEVAEAPGTHGVDSELRSTNANKMATAANALAILVTLADTENGTTALRCFAAMGYCPLFLRLTLLRCGDTAMSSTGFLLPPRLRAFSAALLRRTLDEVLVRAPPGSELALHEVQRYFRNQIDLPDAPAGATEDATNLQRSSHISRCTSREHPNRPSTTAPSPCLLYARLMLAPLCILRFVCAFGRIIFRAC